MTTTKKIFLPELQIIEPVIYQGNFSEFRKNSSTWIVGNLEYRQCDNRGFSRKHTCDTNILDLLLSKVKPSHYYPERRGNDGEFTIEINYNGESLSTVYDMYTVLFHRIGEHVATFEFRQKK